MSNTYTPSIGHLTQIAQNILIKFINVNFDKLQEHIIHSVPDTFTDEEIDFIETVIEQTINIEPKEYTICELSFSSPGYFYNAETNSFPTEKSKATLYTKEQAESKTKELLKQRVEGYHRTGKHYRELHICKLYQC